MLLLQPRALASAPYSCFSPVLLLQPRALASAPALLIQTPILLIQPHIFAEIDFGQTDLQKQLTHFGQPELTDLGQNLGGRLWPNRLWPIQCFSTNRSSQSFEHGAEGESTIESIHKLGCRVPHGHFREACPSDAVCPVRDERRFRSALRIAMQEFIDGTEAQCEVRTV